MNTHIKMCSIAIATSILLAGCGGGGTESSSNSSTNTTPSDSMSMGSGQTITSDGSGQKTLAEWKKNTNLGNKSPTLGVKINEISSNTASVSWFEVYNPNNEVVNLSGHKLRSFSVKNNAVGNIVIFDLPEIAIPANGYAIVSPKEYTWLNSDADAAFVEKNGTLPYWGNNGFIEILYNNKTSDMITFNSLYQPTTSGANIAVISSIADGKQSKALWQSSWQDMNFATPSGNNDTDPNATDDDLDGIPSSAKVPGKTFGGIDVYSMGARKGQKDVFIQHDYMNNIVSIPQQKALDKVKEAFAKHNIALHMDTGNLYSETFNPSKYNLGHGKLFKIENCTTLPTMFESKSGSCTNLFDYKQTMQGMRRSFFHYVFWGKSQTATGVGPSGMAEYNGKNALITLGGWGINDTISTTAEQNLLNNYQAGALMHEIGHNFGLLHGGDEHTTYKPNYISTMNYLYQLRGIIRDMQSNLSLDRYYNFKGYKGVSLCTMVNSPCSNTFEIDYSSGLLANIDEDNLLESNKLDGNNNGYYADWNNDGANNSQKYALDLNQDNTIGTLRDYNDWANLKFNSNSGSMAFKNNNKNTTNSLYMGAIPVIQETNLH